MRVNSVSCLYIAIAHLQSQCLQPDRPLVQLRALVAFYLPREKQRSLHFIRTATLPSPRNAAHVTTGRRAAKRSQTQSRPQRGSCNNHNTRDSPNRGSKSVSCLLHARQPAAGAAEVNELVVFGVVSDFKRVSNATQSSFVSYEKS